MALNYVYVRAHGQSQSCFNFLEQKSVVGVGYSDVNFSSSSDASALLEKLMPIVMNWGWAPQNRGRKMSEVRRFKNLMAGDRILVPCGSGVWLATATDEQIFDTQAGKDFDLANLRKVVYLKDAQNRSVWIPRGELSTGLQSRLRMRGSTCVDLGAYKDEVDQLFDARRWSDAIGASMLKLSEDFREKLVENIQNGDVNLAAGGIGLEQLVVELLNLSGFEAKVLPKQLFHGTGDADIEASLDLWEHQAELLVQVKHHSGFTGQWAAEQLVKTKDHKLYGSKYEEHERLVVTFATPTTQLSIICEQNGIRLVGALDLALWIEESIDQLCPETRNKLGIALAPTVIC
jgi:restriction system protein